jgi:hypothetical protein
LDFIFLSLPKFTASGLPPGTTEFIPAPLDGKTRPTYADSDLDDLHVAEIGALAELGGTYLEVHGKVVTRQARRISDLANDDDELLDLEEAQIRVHEAGEGLWDTVPGLTLNRDEVLLLIPISETNTSRTDLKAPGRQVRVKLYCGPLQVTGFVTVPVDQTVSGWHRTTRSRFLSVTQARVQPIHADLKMDDAEGIYKFVLINRRRLTALIEARTSDASNGAAAAAATAANSGGAWAPPVNPAEPAQTA